MDLLPSGKDWDGPLAFREGLGWTSCLPGRIGMDLLPSGKDWDGPLAFWEGLGWTSCHPGTFMIGNIHDR